MKYIKLLSLLALGLIVGCASNPNKIDAAYVSPLKYAGYDCEQITTEMSHVERRTNVLYQNLKKERNADNWQMGVGLVLFWPTLFALEGGDGAEASEFAQLKGEYEALRDVSVQKKCGIESRSPDEIITSKDDKSKAKAREETIELEVKHRAQVRAIANAKSCVEYVSLLEVTEKTESWLLGCGDDKSLRVECSNNSCDVLSH